MKVRADTIGIAVIVAVFIVMGMFQQWELDTFY